MLESLISRSTEQELMDDFQGSESALKIVLDDINRVNRLLGGNGITVKAVAKLIREHPQDRYVLLDVGCADGTMLRTLADYCRKNNIKVAFIGLDLNTDALNIARKASVNYPEIRYVAQDVLELQPDDFDCDILITTLMTHHFSNAQLPVVLQKFASLVRLGFVNNDLHRSRTALVLFKLFSMFFINTETAKVDGLISIRKGFKKRDLYAFAQQLPQMKHFIKWKWAFRYVWIMEPKRPTA